MAVRAVHVHDVYAGLSEAPGETRSIGAGALHADTLDAAAAAEPSQQLRVAGGVRAERGRAQDPSGAVGQRRRHGCACVCRPPPKTPGRCCCVKMVMPPCGHLTVGGATGRDGGQNTHGAACKGSYRVTSIGPVGARPADRSGPTDQPEDTRPVGAWVRPAPAGRAQPL